MPATSAANSHTPQTANFSYMLMHMLYNKPPLPLLPVSSQLGSGKDRECLKEMAQDAENQYQITKLD